MARKISTRMGALLLSSLVAGTLHAGEAPSTAPAVPDMTSLIKPQDLQAMQRAFGGPASNASAAAGFARRQTDVATMRHLLSHERNLSIEGRDGRVFIDGIVNSEKTQERIQKLVKVYDNIVDLTEFQADEDSMLAGIDLIEAKIEKMLNRNYDPARAFALPQNVIIEVVNDKLLLSGELNNEDDIKQAYWIARVYYDKIVNVLKVRQQMIEITAVFAKVVEKDSSSLGMRGLQSAIFTLPALTMVQGVGNSPADCFRNSTWKASDMTGGFNYQGTTAADNILKLDMLISGEKSAILARPHLAVINGEKGEFLAGGEKAIKNSTANTADTTYKKYGVILHTTPTLTTDGQIRVQVDLEFSVPAASGDDFITFIHKGEAVLSRDQGMSLSGLINEARSRNIDRTPGISQIPILNFFFGQKNLEKDGEELVLLVMPRLPKDLTHVPAATSDRTSKVAEEAFWIHEPSAPQRHRDLSEGKKGDYWVEDKVILQPNLEEEALELKTKQEAAQKTAKEKSAEEKKATSKEEPSTPPSSPATPPAQTPISWRFGMEKDGDILMHMPTPDPSVSGKSIDEACTSPSPQLRETKQEEASNREDHVAGEYGHDEKHEDELEPFILKPAVRAEILSGVAYVTPE